MLLVGCLALPAATVTIAGCGGGGPAAATERLWVSGVPTDPKAPLNAFLTMRSTDDQFLGAFFTGSLLRGQHDVFRWTTMGKDRARIEHLQDGRTSTVKLEPCKPTTGFDLCLHVLGNDAVAGRYQSCKRWVVRRPGKKKALSPGVVVDVMHELSDDDEQLAQALEAAAEATAP